jgi:hypothetical protein
LSDYIVKALSRFNEEFSEAYAAAVVFTERMPEQVNNEIRNCITHLSRAAKCVVDHVDDDVTTSEIASASRHLERAKRDCYKLAVIHINNKLQLAMRVIQDRFGGVVSQIRNAYEAASNERKSIIIEEVNSTEGSASYLTIANRYRSLAAVLMTLYDKLLIRLNPVGRFPCRCLV